MNEAVTRLRGIHHLAMATRDMDRTLRFWRDLLGMRLVAGLGKADYKQYFLEISRDSLITFFEWPDVEPVEEKDHGYPKAGPFIFDHVAFTVEEEAELWQLKDRLAAADFWVSEVIDHGFIHSLYSYDPNGIPIEFCWNVPEVDVRRHPHLVDSAPSAVALEGPEPQRGLWAPVRELTPETERRVYPGEGVDLLEKKNHWGDGTD